MVTPLLRALRERFPGAAVDVLCSRLAAGLLERRPGRGDLLPLRWRNLPYALSIEKQRLVRDLSSRRYDFAVLLERAAHYRSLLERSGIGTIRSFRERPFDPRAHAIVNNLRAAGFDEARGNLDMEVFLSREDREKADQLLSASIPPRIGMHVGYGPRSRKWRQSERLKGWPLESWSRLARNLVDSGARLVFTGSREDEGDVETIVARLPPGSAARSLSGRTSVRELAAVIEKLDLFVSVDSGPAHLAAALGTPLVVLWGPAIFEQVRPMSSRSPVTILRHPPPCAPCYGTPLMKTCPRNVCMEAISPEEVAGEAEKLLKRAAV
jgi:ADP-heptose:LPS heptosyltransferase